MQPGYWVSVDLFISIISEAEYQVSVGKIWYCDRTKWGACFSPVNLEVLCLYLNTHVLRILVFVDVPILTLDKRCSIIWSIVNFNYTLQRLESISKRHLPCFKHVEWLKCHFSLEWTAPIVPLNACYQRRPPISGSMAGMSIWQKKLGHVSEIAIAWSASM